MEKENIKYEKDNKKILNKDNLTNEEYKFIFKKSAKAPINIALIKYWGKSDESEILPLNDSLSLNLDTSIMYTQTEIIFSFKENPYTFQCNDHNNRFNSNNENDKNEKIIKKDLFDLQLYINNSKYKLNQRQIEFFNFICNKYFDSYCSYFKLKIEINSINTIPTSAGCASSSSGGSALVLSTYGVLIDIFKFFNAKENLEDVLNWNISYYTRKISGSASRSIPNGIVVWYKNGEVESIHNNNYWKELRILLVLNNIKEKEYSSSNGMLLSKNTSSLLKYRISNVVDDNMNKIRQYFKDKDFEGLAKITMMDSNSLHAVCLDTFPPLMYLNESSFFLIKIINHINGIFLNKEKEGSNINQKIKCAYTFDAGPNCCIITLEMYEAKIKRILEIIYNQRKIEDKENSDDYFSEFNMNLNVIEKFQNEVILKSFKIENIVSFCVGEGAKLL